MTQFSRVRERERGRGVEGPINHLRSAWNIWKLRIARRGGGGAGVGSLGLHKWREIKWQQNKKNCFEIFVSNKKN